MKNYIIDRLTWNRGDKPEYGKPKLLNQDGFMCCLGFISYQEGCSKEEIINENEPRNVGRKIPKLNYFAKRLKYWNEIDSKNIKNTNLSTKAMLINDNTNIEDDERERRLIELFKKHDIQLTFIN